jgi:hypothetical protein
VGVNLTGQKQLFSVINEIFLLEFNLLLLDCFPGTGVDSIVLSWLHDDLSHLFIEQTPLFLFILGLPVAFGLIHHIIVFFLLFHYFLI